MTNIGNYAFAYCQNLESVVIPDSATSIGNYSFYNCTRLQNVTMPLSAIIYMEEENLKSVTIIHGFGTGTIRKLVHSKLDRNKFVEEYHYGGQGEGGQGATIVNFK